MEFLRRHLPRVYQVVQEALEYITNVTAQIFGAPPDAPQPRNAQAKTPLSSEEAATPAKLEEEGATQGEDHMTLDVLLEDSALEATEESMKIYGMQQDVKIRPQETEVRHRKESEDRRLLDLHHTNSDNKDTFSHHRVTMEKHKDQSHRKVTIDDPKPRKPEDIDDIACSVVREVLHDAFHTVINEEVPKLKQEALVHEEHIRIKTEKEPSTLRLEDLLQDLEPEEYQKHEVPPTSLRGLRSNLNLEIQDMSEEALICYVTVTSEEVHQESPGDVPAPPVIMEFDDLDVPEIKNQHKKLVTPSSEADRSPCDQGEEARKTWEHLQETALRLAMQCHSVHDDDDECKTLGSGEISKTSHLDEIHSSRPDEQGDRGECLEKISHDPKEAEELSSEEKERSDEVSRLSEDKRDQHDQKVEKRRKRVRFSPSTEERDQMFGLTSEVIDGVRDELIEDGALEPTEYGDHPHSRPEPKAKEKDLIQDGALEPTTVYRDHPHSRPEPKAKEENLIQDGALEPSEHRDHPHSRPELKAKEQDHIQDGALEPTTEYMDHPHSRPEPKAKEEDLGFIRGNQDIEPSITDPTTEENQVNPLHGGCTVWYDDPIKMTADEEICQYIGDVICQSMTLGFEETITALEELSSHVHSEEMQDSEEESTKNSGSILSDIIISSGMDFDEEYHHGEGTWTVDFDGSLEKMPSKQVGSIFAEHEERTVSLEVLSQSSEANKVDHVLNEDTESPKRKVLGEDDGEDTDAKEKLLGLVHDPSVEETNESTKGGLTSTTDELILQECVSRLHYAPEGPSGTTATVYTPDERYNQTSVQELDTSINEQGGSHDPSTRIFSKESERYLSSDTTEVQTAEDQAAKVDNKGTGGLDLPMTNETQKEEDLAGKGYYDIEDLKETKHKSLQKQASVKEEHHIQEIEDYTWYRQDSYPGDGLITYSDSNEKPGSQGDREELSKQLPYKDSESEVMFEDGEAGPLEDLDAKDNREVRGSEDLTKVSHPRTVSKTNTSLSAYPEGAFGSDHEFEGVCSHSEIGIDLLTEIQSVIISSQDTSEVTGRSEVTHGAVSSANMEMESIEDNFEGESGFQADQVVKDLDLQSMLMPDHPVGKILGDLAEDDHTTVTLDTVSGHQSLDSVKELEIPLDTGSLAEDHIDVILDQRLEVNNISEPQGSDDLLSELHSLMSMDRPAEVTKTEKDISDIDLDINTTSVEISENKEEDRRAEEDHSPVNVDESLSEHLGDQSLNSVQEVEIPLDTGSPPVGNIEDIKAAISDLISGTLEGAGDLLPNMDSSAEVIEIVSNLDVSDKGEEDGVYFGDGAIVDNLSKTVIVEQQEHTEDDGPSVGLSEERGSIIELEETFEERHYSSIDIIETQVDAADVNDLQRIEIDPSPETHCDLDTTVEKILESEEEEDNKSQSFDIIDDESKRQFGDLKINKFEISLETASLVKDIDVSFLSSVTVDESLSENLGDQSLNSVQEVEIPLDTGSPPEGNIEDIKAAISDLISGPLEGAGDLLPNMDSYVEVIEIVSNLDVSDKWEEDGVHFSDEAIVDNLSKTVIVDQQQHTKEDGPSVGLSEELGSIIKLEHTFEERHYSSIDIIETQVEAADINNDLQRIEIDPSLETHCDLDTTVEKISESEEEEDNKSQSFDILDDDSRKLFGDLEGNELEISLETGSIVKDINASFLSTSELFQSNDDLLSEIQSVNTTDHPTGHLRLVSTPGEEHILDPSKAWEVLDTLSVHSQVDILPNTVILDHQEKIQDHFSAITYSEDFVSSLEPSQELEKNEFSSSSTVSIEDSHVVLDIASISVLLQDQEHKKIDFLSEVQSVITSEHSVEVTTITSTVELTASDEAIVEDTMPKAMTADEKEGSEKATQELYFSQPSEEQEKEVHEQASSSAMLTTTPQVTDITGWDTNKSPKTTDHFGSSDMEIRHPPSKDHAKQEVMEKQAEEQNKHVITIHTEEQSTSREPPTHMEMSEDQGRPLEEHKATLKAPSVEEDDDVDNMLPHNTLDVSAQKSRVQLRRKTSIRRKQGQRQVTPESEPIEPPQPVARPRPMGMPMFPGNMPIFAMAPAMTSEASREQKEEKPAEEELLVKPKKVIPRHAGFGIPHPQMMQELQARMKKKKPNE